MPEARPGSARTRARAPAATRRAAAAPRADRWDFQAESLGYVLRRAQMRAYDLFFAMLDSAGLSPARLTALSMIAIEPDIDQATLARRLRISGPSVVKIVDALEGAGLIARAACADDRRRCALVLVEAGRAKLDEVRAAWPRYENELARGLTATERHQLLALLRKVAGGDE